MSQAAEKDNPYELAHSALSTYVKLQFPDYLFANFHIEIAKKLMLIEQGVIDRLIIACPPRHGKTCLVSEYFAGWYLGRNPSHQIIAATYSHDRATDTGRKVRNQMLGDTFKAIFPGCNLSSDSKSAHRLGTDQNGNYFSVGVGGPITGRGADCLCGETLIKTAEGSIKIKNIVDSKLSPMVLSIDNKTGKISYQKIIAWRKVKSNEIYTIRTNSGNKIRATGRHRFFIPGQGYVKAKDLREGDKIFNLKSEQDLHYVQEAQGWKGQDVQSMLPFINKYRYKGHMPMLRKRVHHQSIQNTKSNEAWPRRPLLFPGLSLQTSFHKESQEMRNLQWPSTKKIYEILFRFLQKNIKTKTQKIIPNKVRILFERISTRYVKSKILFIRLSIRNALNKNAREKSSLLQKWAELYEMVCRNEIIDFFPGQMLCYMPGTPFNRNSNMAWEKSQKNEYECSSYRRRSKQEFAGRSNIDVYNMSYSPPQIEYDTISSITIDSHTKHDVYDIQVERNSNFFANEILVHNCLIIDDPIKGREEAESEISRRKLIEWYKSVAYTRLMPGGRIIVIATRWHFDDLTGFLQSDDYDKWTMLKFPAIAEETCKLTNRNKGDALWPEKYPVDKLINIKHVVGSREWSSLYQQEPLNEEGAITKLSWFQRYDESEFTKYDVQRKLAGDKDASVPFGITNIVISWDTAFKESEINTPSCATVWGISPTGYYLMYIFNKQINFPKLKRNVVLFYERYMNFEMGPVVLLIEDKASGQSLIQVLEEETSIPIIKIKPIVSKILRMESVTHIIESGRVYIPKNGAWLSDFERQMSQFPLGKFNDIVDSTSQFLRWVAKPKPRRRGLKFWK